MRDWFRGQIRLKNESHTINTNPCRRWLCRCTSAPITQRDKAFLYQPTSPRYGYEVGILCSSFLLAFAFAVVSPIVTIGEGEEGLIEHFALSKK